MSWRKKKRRNNLAPRRRPVCGKRFSHPKALYGHMRCHSDHMWRGITQPVSEEQAEVAALLVGLSSGEGARAKRYVCSWCGKVFETPQGLGGHQKNQYKGVNSCRARYLEGRKGSGVHGARNVRRGSNGDEGRKQIMRIGQKMSGGRWKASKEAATAEEQAEVAALLVRLSSGEGARAKRYVCSWCGKVFETPQDLGGHHKNQYCCHQDNSSNAGL